MRIAPSGPLQVLDYRAPGQPAGLAPRSTTMARGATSKFSAAPPGPAEPRPAPPVSAELAGAGIARLAAEKPAAPEDGMRPAQRRQGRDELDQVGVLRSGVPVDPGDLVVLAVAVVVALLRPA